MTEGGMGSIRSPRVRLVDTNPWFNKPMWKSTLAVLTWVPALLAAAACSSTTDQQPGTGGDRGSGGSAVGTGGSGGRAGGGSGGSGTGGSGATAGQPGSGGATGSGGAGGSGLPPFSFFVTSLQAMRDLSNNVNGFGGDLRFGETGEGAGLRGADKICSAIAERSMPGAGKKQWRAFLSAVAAGPGGTPVHAKDRIGQGPWFDRLGRRVASNIDQLLMVRPGDADAAIRDDLPNENGIPNHTDGAPGCTGTGCPDNHDTLTGTNASGMLYSMNMRTTCNDWTSSEGLPGGTGGASGSGGAGGAGGAGGTGGRGGIGTRGMGPWCGHSWPRKGSGENWMSALAEGGCAPGVNLMEQGGPMTGVYTVGTGGGYGGIYCFALTP